MATVPTRSGSPRQLTTKQTGDGKHKRVAGWKAKRLRFVAANVNERGGEIDLIMREGRTTVFLSRCVTPLCALWRRAAASVTRSKQHKLLQTARLWLARHNGSF